jgi:hypothetical protein
MQVARRSFRLIFAYKSANLHLTTAQAATLKRSFKIKYLAACRMRSTRARRAGEQGERGERYKRVTFTAYLHETKGPVNVVNVARGFLVVAHAACQLAF